MHCPFCSEVETKVIDSRLVSDGRQVRRRRECLSCSERYTTFETPELVMPKWEDPTSTNSGTSLCLAESQLILLVLILLSFLNTR